MRQLPGDPTTNAAPALQGAALPAAERPAGSHLASRLPLARRHS